MRASVSPGRWSGRARSTRGGSTRSGCSTASGPAGDAPPAAPSVIRRCPRGMTAERDVLRPGNAGADPHACNVAAHAVAGDAADGRQDEIPPQPISGGTLVVDTPAPVTLQIAQANDAPDATVSVERTALDELVSGAVTIEAIMASGRLAIDGDQPKFIELLELHDPPDRGFAIVTP